MKKNIVYLLILLLSCSCNFVNNIKISKTLEGGKLGSYSFTREIAFQNRKEFIIIQVNINGKFYDFLFDTGAMTTIDYSLAKEIKNKPIGSRNISDANGKVLRNSYTKIDRINIAGVDFNDIGTAIIDMGILKKRLCNDNIKGIIGYNILNKAIWQIDYSNKKIILTDIIESLNFSDDKVVTNFYDQKKPKIRLATQDNYIAELIIDTGSSGGISVPSYREKNFIDSLNFLNFYGISSAVFSSVVDSSRLVAFPSLIVGQHLEVKNSTVSFRNTLKEGLIGNNFLKDYIITLNWKAQEVIFCPYKLPINRMNTFGFRTRNEDNKLIISSIIEKTDAYMLGLSLYDEILQINDINFENASDNQLCNFNIEDIEQKSDTLLLKVKRNEKIIDFRLLKSDLSAYLK